MDKQNDQGNLSFTHLVENLLLQHIMSITDHLYSQLFQSAEKSADEYLQNYNNCQGTAKEKVASDPSEEAWIHTTARIQCK